MLEGVAVSGAWGGVGGEPTDDIRGLAVLILFTYCTLQISCRRPGLHWLPTADKQQQL